MPPAHPRRRFFLKLLVALIILAAASAWAGRLLGHALHQEDPLVRADAIFVLAGDWLERVVEGGDLYLEGHAPLVVLSRQAVDYGEAELKARGHDGLGISDVHTRALTLMGVPREAIHVIEPQVATATEAQAIKRLALARGWRTVIVVTSKLHTARAGLVIRRNFDTTGVRVVMRATRYDRADVDYWWRSRSDLRFVLLEAEKFILYWTGIAD